MSMTQTLPGIESLTLLVTKEIHVRASIEDTFEALLEQIGPQNSTPEGVSFPLKIEPWPGGRWFRDLGNDNGHFWGNVQAIKRPTLLEFSGPLMMSHPVANNVQYRLSQSGNGTLIKFRHSGFGLLPEDHKKGINGGWTFIHSK